MTPLLWLALGWVWCGIGASGVFYASCQRDHRYSADEHRLLDSLFAIAVFVSGPIGVVLVLFYYEPKGWLLPFTVPKELRP